MDKPTIEQLREQVRAPVITAEDPGYDDARAVHNGMFDRRPLVIIQAEQVADVIAGVNFARDAGLDLSVRGGGHSAPGFGTNDGGVVLDLSPMRSCPRRPARAHGSRRRRCHVGRLQLRHARLRAGDHRWDRLHDRHRRADAGRRHRLPDPRLRAVDRQPGLRRRGDGRRAGAQRRATEERGSVLGPSGRRRQLRGRHIVRVRSFTPSTTSTSASSSTSSNTRDPVAVLPRVHPECARGIRRVPRVPDRAAVAVHPRRPPRRHLLRCRRALGRAARRRRERDEAVP